MYNRRGTGYQMKYSANLLTHKTEEKKTVEHLQEQEQEQAQALLQSTYSASNTRSKLCTPRGQHTELTTGIWQQQGPPHTSQQHCPS